MLMELCGSCLPDLFSLFLDYSGSPDNPNSMDPVSIENTLLPCIARTMRRSSLG